MKLKIGTLDFKSARWQAGYTQRELARIGVESELVIVKSTLEDALLGGDIDLLVLSMNELSTQQPEGLVITAVSYRQNPAELLIIRPEAVDKSRIFRLKEGAVVGSSAVRRITQLADFRPDTLTKDISGDLSVQLENLRTGDYDAIFLAAADIAAMDPNISNLEIVELNPREFVPAPAQGVLAWLANREDVETRRILQKIHRPDVSAVTNVERKVLQLMENGCIGVYCDRDATGNFHAFAACHIDEAMHRARVSQNTSAGLAERIVTDLRK